MSFCENLIQARKLRGMTQEELAEKLDISRQAVSKWENGESVPDTDKLIRLGDVLGVSLDELAGKASAPTPQARISAKKAGVRPAIAILLCLLAAVCGFVLGGLLRPFGGHDAPAEQADRLPAQLTADHVEIIHYGDGSTIIRFVSNVTLDGKVFLSRGEGLTPVSAEAKWSGGIYRAELKTSAEDFAAFDSLTFVVESGGVQRSVLLATQITLEPGGGAGFIPAQP